MVKWDVIPMLIYSFIGFLGIEHAIFTWKISENISSSHGKWTAKEWESGICEMRTNKYLHPFAFRNKISGSHHGHPLRSTKPWDDVGWDMMFGKDEELNACTYKDINTISTEIT